ncbi:hypothetical protein C8J57DRAFT_1247623 [Mycena rebaudengoi]|nr:hypothetical protein C8J57DRAFT_1247623 [Mycena rebaudengoi]
MIGALFCHNNPKFPSTKVSRKGKEVYHEAIAAAGVTGLTILKSASVSKIFGGSIPAAFDPALANPRNKHSLIQEVKRVKSPYGLGIEGMQEIVVTMLPYLAEHVHGPWKEWEVMWPGLFETIGHITKLEVKFKFIDGEGLCAILVDGNKPQANALGAYLVTRNRPDTSGIRETDPKLILFNILRTCIFHFERKFAEMTKTVPDEPMGRIRRSPYSETQPDLGQGFNPMVLSFE